MKNLSRSFFCLCLLRATHTGAQALPVAEPIEQAAQNEFVLESIQDKECFSKLIARMLGRVDYNKNKNFEAILKANPQIKDPNLVFPGDKVLIPKSLIPNITPPPPELQPEVVTALPAPLIEVVPEKTPEEIAKKINEEQQVVVSKNPVFGPRDKIRELSTYGAYFEANYGETKALYAANHKSMGGVYRLGAGFYYNDFEINGSYRKTISGNSAVQFRPEWLQISLGYGWKFQQFKSVKPMIAALIGYGIFTDKVVAVESFSYISKIQFFTVGFRSRFTIGNWDLGGTFLAGIPQAAYQRFYLQGDLSYWLYPWMRAGAGYWYDRHSAAATTTSEKFTEKQLGLEALVVLYF